MFRLLVLSILIHFSWNAATAVAQPPIRIQPRQQTAETPEQNKPLPQIIPSPRPYDSAVQVRVDKSRAAPPALVSEINRRNRWQIRLSRTVRATSAGPGNSVYQYVNPTNREDLEVRYDSQVATDDRLRELRFGAPWQFPYQLQQGTITYRFSNTPFVADHRLEELDTLYNEFLKYSPVLTRNSLLQAYSPADNLFQRDAMLRLRRDVPELLREKMESSRIDEELIESRHPFDRKGPCELRTVLWLSGVLEKVEDSLQRTPSSNEHIEVLTNYSEPVLVYQEGMYYFIFNQCFLTAIRSTLEPEVIHVCLVEFEMHKYKEFVSAVVPNVFDLRSYRYKLSRTWSLGTLE